MTGWTLQDWANVAANFTKGVTSLFSTGIAETAAAAAALHWLYMSGLTHHIPLESKIKLLCFFTPE